MKGKRIKKRPSRFSKLARRIAKTPHLYAKATIAYCIAFATFASYYSLRIMSRTGADPSGLLGVILGFFGGELLLLLLKTVLKKEDKPSNKFNDTGI